MSTFTATRIHRDTCPVCHESKLFPICEAKDHTVSHERFSIWECPTCKLRFTQDIPDEQSIGAYYESEDYISHSDTDQGIINRLYQQVRQFTLKQKRRKIEKITKQKTGNLLDIGCGTGDFAATMQASGWKVLGLEPDEKARLIAKEKNQIDVGEPDHLFQLEENRFDVVTMWHVLEHVHRLHEYIDQIRTILKPDGVLLIAVPNYQSSDAAHYGETWAAYDVPRHLYHFSPETMRRLASDHMFHVEHYGRMPFDSFYVSLLSEKYRGNRVGLISGGWEGFKSYAASLANPQRGSSVLYIIRPSANL